MIEKIFTFIGIAVVSIVLVDQLYNYKARRTEKKSIRVAKNRAATDFDKSNIQISEDKELKISKITESHIDEKSLRPMTDEEIENLNEMSPELENGLEAILKYILSDPRRENKYRSLQSEINTISSVLQRTIAVGNSFQNKNSAQEYLHNNTVARFNVSLSEAQLRLIEYNLTAWHEMVALNLYSDNLDVNDFNKLKIFILRMKKKYQEDLATNKAILDALSNTVL